MNECVKIKCDYCKFVDDCVDYGWDGCRKFTQKASEPLTNEEWLRSCTTQQLAEFLYETGFMGMWQVDMMRNAEKEKITVVEAIQMWLKQPHKPFS